MIVEAHKSKQYLLAIAKVLLLVITFGYIFYKLKSDTKLDFDSFIHSIITKGVFSIYVFIFLLILAAANWFFEILKWKTLVATITKINFKTAQKQALASLTVSLATPNRIGEYGAKALFFKPENHKKVLLLNFFSGTIQMLVTVGFGSFGIFYLLQNFEINYSAVGVISLFTIIALVIIIGYYFKEKELFFKGFSLQKIYNFLKDISLNIKLKTVIFSIFRYLIFSSMFYVLLLFFGAKISVIEALPIIFAMYLLVSIFPTFFMFDVVIRGGVAVWLFSLVEIPELIILSTVLAMWILNFVLPAIIGSFYVLTFQPATR
ncbi:MAG: hypothetical protein CL526_03605 [Aequorivita sp.]|nr:hypothetical protein [Aequorivita sp.]|tara:strand:- start:38085 stop:39041 length:957 start_codon:yes stop_codon:yes gene_type:complete